MWKTSVLDLTKWDVGPVRFASRSAIEKTIRLSSRAGLVIPEVLELLKEHAILETDVSGVFRGQPGDHGIYVELCTGEGAHTGEALRSGSRFT